MDRGVPHRLQRWPAAAAASPARRHPPPRPPARVLAEVSTTTENIGGGGLAPIISSGRGRSGARGKVRPDPAVVPPDQQNHRVLSAGA